VVGAARGAGLVSPAADGSSGARLGRVALVGAGPGDPELITVKGRRLLEQADAVVFDALVGRELLALARPDAQLIDVGKRDSRHTLPQAEINARLTELSRAGLDVVRLKGGDPFVFGRGGEEALALAAAGVPFEVVPGVTSGTSVPASAGIPVTHRDLARSVTFFTAHTSGDGKDNVDYQALARVGGTLVAFMGLGRLARVARSLVDAGCRPALPAAVIAHGTTPRQVVVRGTLQDIAAQVERRGVEAPALVVIGEVVTLSERLEGALHAATLTSQGCLEPREG
jgi:uroporphyrin-III C-methyltransferase